MSFNVYYQDELLALRTLGREFAQRNPALAPFLDTPGRDPDVERILEGFPSSRAACARNWTMSCRRSPTPCSICSGPTICGPSRRLRSSATCPATISPVR